MAEKLFERVAAERRRLREVRQALTVATAPDTYSNETFVPFYIAIAEYFEAAMGRLHAQDIRMGEMLDSKADMAAPENKQAMAELDERLAGNQLHLKKMLAARDDTTSKEKLDELRVYMDPHGLSDGDAIAAHHAWQRSKYFNGRLNAFPDERKRIAN